MTELTIQLSDETSKCLYLQIYEYIRDEIRKGKLLTGEKLPSTRSLAEYLQVARSTVDSAYSQLVAEGYLTARPHKGYFVNPVEELLEIPSHEADTDKRNVYRGTYGERREEGKSVRRREEKSACREEGKPAHRREEESAHREQADKKPLYDFSPHAVSLKDFPYATWKKITRNILVDANREIFARGDAQGDLPLRETIARYLHSSRGVNCRPEQIVVGAGTDYLFMLLEKILGRHVPIAMEEPTYERAYQIFQSFAYEITAIPVDGSGMSVEKLRQSGARLAYVMPSHQYPTGIVMPIGRRMELLRWAMEKQDRYLIEDDYDSEFRYRGKPIPSLQASDGAGKVIYMGTFSKSIAPAIRVGYMVLPKSLLESYRNNCGCYASTVSRIDQRILDEFIRNGYFERYLNKMRKIYKEKHDYLLTLLHPFEKSFRISGENAGLHLLLTNENGVPKEELLLSAEKEGIRVYGMSKACMEGQETEKAFRNTILLGYGALDKSELKEGIELLKKAWSAYL
ncbi:MAG: PLP-dependent aminotransferase family protein [Lachnospiraceae bacterium]|nr:PLP-dependent aminotransferase family protein [Lachnospiraceae bacterium]